MQQSTILTLIGLILLSGASLAGPATADESATATATAVFYVQ